MRALLRNTYRDDIVKDEREKDILCVRERVRVKMGVRVCERERHCGRKRKSVQL